MPRQISHAALTAMLAQSTGEVFIELLTINHASLTDPIRLCNNGEEIVSNGLGYSPASFKAELPADAEDREPRALMSVSNVDQSIVGLVRGLKGRPTFTIAVVTASEPNVYEFAPHSFDVISVRGDVNALQFEMVFSELAQETFPKLHFSPVYFRALHRRTT